MPVSGLGTPDQTNPAHAFHQLMPEPVTGKGECQSNHPGMYHCAMHRAISGGIAIQRTPRWHAYAPRTRVLTASGHHNRIWVKRARSSQVRHPI
jgi:hypothetical protein